ncbi:ETX/MTX2 family pore-forming toxin [Bacillus cereus]|nr:ETX/MTX2 family pore-forming toxin [Bacillus cereus]
MKTYKKLATLAPIAVLSTSILFSPTMTFAAEKTTSIPMKSAAIQTSNVAATSGFNMEQLKNDIKKRIIKNLKESSPSLTIDESSLQFSSLDNIYLTYVNSGNININAQVDSYTDDGAMELLRYRNESPVNQTQKTTGKSKTHTESSTYSNTEGVQLGVGSETKVDVSIPFVAEGGEIIKLTSEFSYNHSTSSTTTNTTTETFPEQSVICVPNATTVYTGLIRSAKFSGTYTGAALVKVKDNNIITVTGKATDSNGTTYTVAKGYGGEILGAVYENKDLPSYIEVQDNKTVLKDVTTTFTGLMGHEQIVKTEVYSLDGKQKVNTVEMSLKDFQNPQIRNAKLAEIQQ